MSAFKVGDRVRRIHSDPGRNLPVPPIGAKGVVLQDDTDIPWVAFPGYNGASLSIINHPEPDAFVMAEYQLELIP